MEHIELKLFINSLGLKNKILELDTTRYGEKEIIAIHILDNSIVM